MMVCLRRVIGELGAEDLLSSSRLNDRSSSSFCSLMEGRNSPDCNRFCFSILNSENCFCTDAVIFFRNIISQVSLYHAYFGAARKRHTGYHRLCGQ